MSELDRVLGHVAAILAKPIGKTTNWDREYVARVAEAWGAPVKYRPEQMVLPLKFEGEK